MPTNPKKTLEFGPFRLLVEKRALLCDGRPVQITPRAAEVLGVLATQANEIVSKEDLLQAVWPDTFVEEANLSVQIAALRKLLAGVGGTIQIETVPKRGYRLVGEVRAIRPGPEPSSGDTHPMPAHSIPVSRVMPARKISWIALAILLLVIAAAGLERWSNRAQAVAEAGGARIHSLAVLPLQNLSGDPAQDYFAAGITDELTTELAHIHGLQVASRTSASQFQSANRSLPEIAHALGVEGVMEGSVVRAGNHVRITTQLIEARNDRHLWAGSYEGSVDEIIVLQDRVARDVAREVRAAVKPESAPFFSSAQAPATGVNPQAYDDYLRGLYIWNRRDVRTFDEAIKYFSSAATEDPHFAPAYASLADVYVLYSLNGAGASLGPMARRAALQALALDGDSAEAHTALGAVSAVFEWDWVSAGHEFQRAVDLNPNYATARQWYADFYLVPELRLDEAAGELDAAVALDPLSPIMFVDRGWVDYLHAGYPQARQKYDRALAMDPDFTPAIFRLQEWYLVQGREAEYAQTVGRLTRLSSGAKGETQARLIEAGFAKDGMRGGARARLELARQTGAPHWDWGLAAAEIFAQLGDSARTCAALRGGIKEREPALLYVNVDPTYAVVRASPCYPEVAKQIGLPQLPLPQSAAPTSARSFLPATHPQATN
jgi:TolB-like protein/DNA-binding winged helix-turn-helix (wHTH) protein/Tfp pilus assembly protein PilF